jgi:TonB family protein
MHALAGGSGSAGTARAHAEVSSQLAGTTSSLKSALAGLNASLGTTSSATGGSVSRGGRARAVRGAAGVADLDRVSGSLAAGAGSSGVGTGGGGDLGGSAVAGSLVSIGDLSVGGGGSGGGLGSGTGSGGGGPGGTGTGSGSGTGGGSGGGSGVGSIAGPGVHRSNASLLAVIQRYAPGIQFCYGNELKRDPSLRGKLVMALVVDASGEVTEARVVLNNTGSPQLAACALAQVRDWRFPAIPSGVTTFQAPFVFTPPQ